MKKRTRSLVVRVDDRELAMAHQLANECDEPMTMLIRRLVKEAHAEKFGAEKTKARVAK
jgi:hypothetical protein